MPLITVKPPAKKPLLNTNNLLFQPFFGLKTMFSRSLYYLKNMISINQKDGGIARVPLYFQSCLGFLTELSKTTFDIIKHFTAKYDSTYVYVSHWQVNIVE